MTVAQTREVVKQKVLDSGYIFIIKPKRYPDGLDMGCEKEKKK